MEVVSITDEQATQENMLVTIVFINMTDEPMLLESYALEEGSWFEKPAKTLSSRMGTELKLQTNKRYGVKGHLFYKIARMDNAKTAMLFDFDCPHEKKPSLKVRCLEGSCYRYDSSISYENPSLSGVVMIENI